MLDQKIGQSLSNSQDTAEYIRKNVRDFYANVPQSKIIFQGGFKVFGVDTDRSKNKTFLDYRVSQDHSNLYYSEIKEDIPEEAK